MTMTSRRADLLGDWILRNHARVIKYNDRIEVLEYQSQFLHCNDMSDFESSATAAIKRRQMDMMTLVVPIESIIDLVTKEHKLEKLMRLPEVQEAMMYYTLNGYLND
jgi:hypothetical protein